MRNERKVTKKVITLLLTLAIILCMLSQNVLTPKAASYTMTVTQNTYVTLKNVGSGKYLNVYGNKNANNTNITVYAKDNTSGQDFKFVKCGAGYVLVPRCATSRVVNIYANTAKSGNNVCLWSKTGDSTQIWIPEYDATYKAYILRSANNKSLVLTSVGSNNSSNVNVQTYKKGNRYQLWTSSALNVKANTTTVAKPAASTLKITGRNSIGTINSGSYVTIKGTVSSNYNLNYVNAYILKSDGKTIVYGGYSHQLKNTKSYSLANSAVDKALSFNKLSAGTYYYKVTAQDTSGKALTLVNEKFTVKANENQTLTTQITNTDKRAKSLSGKNNFNGYCGAYVYWELCARGIYTGAKSSYESAANGNKWYGLIGNSKYTKSTGGYKTLRYAGANALDTLSNNGKKNVYNIVVSYTHGYGSGYAYGHVVYIHAIYNGKVYFSECYNYNNVKAGNPIVMNYSTFKNSYKGLYGNTLGAVVFTK